LDNFGLKIEQFWSFEEISIFSNGGHLGHRTVLKGIILKGDHSRIISAKFG
jgi:metal-responsive CopG/Arc/MetJ family transcriptional regulator